MMQWSQNLCRTCGQISETCHFIYNRDVPSTLESKIKKCLKLDLCKGDYKPKQICHNCVIKLNDLTDFIDTCYVTNQKFESIYYNSQNWHNRSFDCNSSQKQSVIVSNRQVPDNLDYELYKNTGIVLENLNVTNYPLNDPEMLDLVSNGDYTSENCNNFVMDAKQKGHYTTVLRHPNSTDGCFPPDYGSSHSIENNEVNNKICYIKYDNAYNSNTDVNTTLNCQDINLDPGKKKTVTVYAVQKSITLPSKKREKQKIKKSYQCPNCDRIFSRRSSLNSHMAVHTNRRPYKCDECLKTFAIKSDLTNHKRNHNGKHKCTFCPKNFAVPSKLDRHIRIHTNEKPFVCSYPNCSKAFSDKRNLEGHKFTHINEKNYSCTVCNKTFKTAGRLKQHLKSHTTCLMYSCELCSKQYKYKSNLISHIKKHNNICPYCKKNCESNTLLTEHIKLCTVRN